jgi:tetratricopeptide (TPR) repeat protein
VRAVELTKWLLNSGLSLTENACQVFVNCLSGLIPMVPKPIIPDFVVDNQSVPARVFALAKRLDASEALIGAATVCYRLHEGRGEYAKARVIIAMARDHAEKNEALLDLAKLTNNFGYEYLLEGNYSAARPHFAESIELFQQLEDENEVANVQANLLSCDFALLPPEQWESLLPMLSQVHSILFADRDWRLRKTMRLFAMRAEAQGRMPVAMAWARRAVTAARQVKSRLYRDDELYLNGLRLRLGGEIKWK